MGTVHQWFPLIWKQKMRGNWEFTTIDPGSSKTICGSSHIRMNSGPKAWKKQQQKITHFLHNESPSSDLMSLILHSNAAFDKTDVEQWL